MKNIFSLIAVFLFLVISIASAAPPGDRHETKMELQKQLNVLSDVVILVTVETIVTDVINTDVGYSVFINKPDVVNTQSIIEEYAILEAPDIYSNIQHNKFQLKQNYVLEYYLSNYL
jgi:hypothetical protein